MGKLDNELAEAIVKAVPGVDPTIAANLARQSAADLVTDITDDQRKAVARLTARAFTEGWTDDELATRIRQKVGLTPRMAVAVENYRAGLVKNGTPLGNARKLANDYANRLRTQRATVIAANELARLTAEAKRLMWADWKETGKIDQYAVRVWHTTADEKKCRICKPMNGQRAAIGKSYSRSLSGPPAHVSCRCWETLERGPVLLGKTELSEDFRHRRLVG